MDRFDDWGRAEKAALMIVAFAMLMLLAQIIRYFVTK